MKIQNELHCLLHKTTIHLHYLILYLIKMCSRFITDLMPLFRELIEIFQITPLCNLKQNTKLDLEEYILRIWPVPPDV